MSWFISISPLRILIWFLYCLLFPSLYVKWVYSKVPNHLVNGEGGWKSLWKRHMTERRLKMTPSTSINQFVLSCVALHCPLRCFQLINTLKSQWFSQTQFQSLCVCFCIKEIGMLIPSFWVSDFLFFFLNFWIGGAKHKRNITVHRTFLSFLPFPAIFQFLCQYCSSSSKLEHMSARFWGILAVPFQIVREERFLHQSFSWYPAQHFP